MVVEQLIVDIVGVLNPLLIALIVMALLHCYECLAFVEVPIKNHDGDLQEEGDHHLPRELVVGQAITDIADISIHLGVEEYHKDTDQ